MVPTMQQRLWDLLVLGHGIPGAMAAAAGTGNQGFGTAGALRPACWPGIPGATALLQAQRT
jgi:hypothetical protein